MRKKLKNRKTVVSAALIPASAGLLCRLLQTGTGSRLFLILLILLSSAAVLLSVAVTLNLKPRPGFLANNRPSTAQLLELLASLLFLGVSVALFLTQTGLNRWLIGLGGVVGALCMGAIPMLILMRKRPPLALFAALTLSLILRLIPQFRAWSIDPAISSYCFRLFATLAFLCVCFHRGEFVLESGHRGTTVFWCISGITFCGIAVADGPWSARIFYLAALLYLSATLWSVMSPPRKRRRAKPSTSS